MATLEKIRRRSGLLLILVGLAILAFILTDLLRSGNSIFRSNARVVGRANGATIEIDDFQRRMDERMKLLQQQNPQQAQSVSRIQLANTVWDEFLRQQILREHYRDLGFQVTTSELVDRVKNNPTIQNAQAFKDPRTGQFSDARFQQYLSNLQDNRLSDEKAAEAYKQWVDFEKAIKEQAGATKYYNAIQKGIYMPRALAKLEHKQSNLKRQVQYTGLPYADIADSTVEYSDSDLKAYYRENKDEYKTEQSRGIAYVNIPIRPSNKDRSAIKKELRDYLSQQVVMNKRTKENDTIESFRNAENDSAFAAARSDLPVQGGYVTKDNLPQALDSTIFERETGFVKGPYLDGDYYKLTKIAGRKQIPDSVNARHMLISYQGANNGQSQSQRSPQQARKLADSLLTIVKEDTSRFVELAKANSDDRGTKVQGGNLGWFEQGDMVPAFSNYAFYNETGDVGMVFSRFGIHIINILDQRGSNEGLKLISIAREILPSEATRDSIYNVASNIASQASNTTNLGAAAQENGYSVRPIGNLEPFDNLVPGVGENREIVKWCYKEKTAVGDIQLFNNNDESYVVSMLTEVETDGYAPFENVKESIRPKVIKEKKAEQLSARVQEVLDGGASDINAVVSALGTDLKTQEITFSTATLTTFGNEPRVIGVMSAMEQGELSGPIDGNLGVYVAQVQSVKPYAELPSYAQQQARSQGVLRRQVQNQVYEALKEQAEIEDNRPKFY